MKQESGNNPLFVGEWAAPFELKLEQGFDKGKLRFGNTRALVGRLFVTRAGGYLACIDPDSREVVWELEREQTAVVNTLEKAGSLFANFEGAFAGLDRESGRILWESEEREIVRDLSSESLFVSGQTGRKPYIGCRDIESRDLRWKKLLRRGLVTRMVDSGAAVVVGSTEGIQFIDVESGTATSEWGCREWCEEHFSDRLRERERQQPGAKKVPYFSIGPVKNGVAFVSTGIGIIIAFDTATGNVRWMREVTKTYDWARTMICREDKLYSNFHLRPGICSLNVHDGAIAFHTEEEFTPAGCHNPVMLNRLLVGGSGQHLAALDVETQECVWRYRYPKPVPVFGSLPCATDKGFVIPNDEARTLMWFESTA